jgi:hypothetical protein
MWTERPRPVWDGMIIALLAAAAAAANIAAIKSVQPDACQELVVPVDTKPIRCPPGTKAEVDDDIAICKCPNRSLPPPPGFYNRIPNADPPPGITSPDSGLIEM